MPILHTVSFKVKAGVTDAQMDEACRAADLQGRMPHLVHNYVWGKSVSLSDRPADCKEFQWILTMVFKTKVCL